MNYDSYQNSQDVKSEVEQWFYDEFARIVTHYLHNYVGPKPLYKWSAASQRPLIKNDLIEHLPTQALAKIWVLLEQLSADEKARISAAHSGVSPAHPASGNFSPRTN